MGILKVIIWTRPIAIKKNPPTSSSLSLDGAGRPISLWQPSPSGGHGYTDVVTPALWGTCHLGNLEGGQPEEGQIFEQVRLLAIYLTNKETTYLS